MAAPGSTQRARFIVLDGIDGCGKSTQAAVLCAALTRPGAAAPLHLREPGGTALGERLRAVLLDPGLRISAQVETLLFAASRRALLSEVVSPALDAGRDVVCERSNASTFAYQAVAGGLDEEEVLGLLLGWSNDPAPDLMLWLDLPVREAQKRLSGPRDRIEAQGAAFQERVAKGFARWSERVGGLVRIDATGERDAVAGRILDAVRGSLGALT